MLYLLITRRVNVELNIKQFKVSPITFAKHYANSFYFRSGYDSIIKNADYDYTIVCNHDAIAYARGRMFAIWCKQNNAPRAVWRKGVAAKTLVERVAIAATRKDTFV